MGNNQSSANSNSQQNDNNNSQTDEIINQTLSRNIDRVKDLLLSEQKPSAILCESLKWLEEQFYEAEKWLKLQSSTLKQNLSDIISDYGNVLDETLTVSTEVLKIIRKWKHQILIIQNIRNAKDEDAKDYFKDYDKELLKQKPPMDKIDKLIARYVNLSVRLDKEKQRLEEEEKNACKRFLKFVGIAALSTIILAGCITAIVFSAGAATPALVVGAVVVADAAAVTTAAAGVSIVGIVFGCLGAAASTASIIASATMLKKIKDMEQDMINIEKKFKEIKEGLKITESKLELFRSDLDLASNDITLELAPKQKDDKLIVYLKSIHQDTLNKIEKEISDVEKDIENLRNEVKKHREKYLNDLITIQFQLDQN